MDGLQDAGFSATIQTVKDINFSKSIEADSPQVADIVDFQAGEPRVGRSHRTNAVGKEALPVDETSITSKSGGALQSHRHNNVE